MKKCDLCDKTAVLRDQVLVDGQWKPVHLCEEHARAQGYQGVGGALTPTGQPVEKSVRKQPAGKRRRVASCETCGLTLAAFRRQGLLGCPDCYRCFEPNLEPIIARAQGGATTHCGHVPSQEGAHVDRRVNRTRLLKELNDAVLAEQYERAARIRDELQGIESTADPVTEDATEKD